MVQTSLTLDRNPRGKDSNYHHDAVVSLAEPEGNVLEDVAHRSSGTNMATAALRCAKREYWARYRPSRRARMPW